MKYLFTLFYLFYFFVNTNAQINLSYSIGVVGSDFKTSTYSYPFSINGKNCIVVSTGLSKFLVSDQGIFLNECALNTDYNQFNILLAPNPASNYTIIKLSKKTINEDKYNIILFGMNGYQLKRFQTNQMQLLQGYKLAMNELSEGVYFIQIISNRTNQVLRLIKLN